MYSIGGWATMPRSCSSGFRSRPSSAAGISRSNGLDVSRMNSRNPTPIRPITPRIRATIGCGKWRLNTLTANIQKLRINSHSSIDPSWPPQNAAIL